MGPRAIFPSQRIPVLDGWRGIAILMVLITHYQDGILRHFIFGQRWLDLGQHGVTIFFVLSGYLITSNLLSKPSIELPRFYARRFFRLMPAAWFYLLTLVLLTALTSWKVIGHHDLWASLLFYRNYLGETPISSSTLHFWSLSLEEQFYLVWPPVLALFGRRNANLAALIGALSIAGYRAMHWQFYSACLNFQRTEVRADALLVGCLLALVLQDARVRTFFVKYAKVLSCANAVALALDIYRFQKLIPLTEATTIAVLIGVTSLNPDLWLSRVLRFEHLETTGKLSYSIYLWQNFFLRYNFAFLGIFLLPLMATFSYVVIELPGIALGRKIMGGKTSPLPLEPARV
jgi:peptidoglycan/LPS O-acetylase OafA/YrhL